MAKVKPKRPTRDEFELEELGKRLVEAKEENTLVQLTVWSSEPVKGVITKLDSRTKLVHVELDGDTAKVAFMDIMKMSNAD